MIARQSETTSLLECRSSAWQTIRPGEGIFSFLDWDMGYNYPMSPTPRIQRDLPRRQRLSATAVNLGLGANILLAGLKTSIGVLSHSPALLAEGINSTSDVAYYVVVSIFMRLSRKPADDAHPYGHSQLESISALVVGAFVIATAIAIFWNAVDTLFDLVSGVGVPISSHSGALYVALFTVGLKLFLMFFTRSLARETESPTVLALAYDHRNDVFSASGAAIGIWLSKLGYTWGDPLAGAIVALIILRTGIEIVRQSSAELMDAVPSRELAAQVDELVSSVPGVLSLEEVHSHRFGPYVVLNLTICVDGEISVRQGDEIASEVEDVLAQHIPYLGMTHVHYHPLFIPGDPTGKQPPRRLLTLE